MLAYQAWIWLHTSDLALAAQWAQMADVRLDDPQSAERKIAYWVYGEFLLAQGQYAQTLSILGQLMPRVAEWDTDGATDQVANRVCERAVRPRPARGRDQYWRVR
jgi:hypothetical protein